MRRLPFPSRRAFTLIEVLIVVAVIGLIAAIAIPNMKMALQRARQVSTTATLRNYGTELERYSVDNNGYPGVDNMADLRAALATRLNRAPQTLYNKLNHIRRLLALCLQRRLEEERA